MKVYILKDGTVTVSENGERRELLGGPFTWGEKAKALPTTASLAKAILTDLLGEPLLADRLYMRFKWRTVASWAPVCAYTADELMAVVRIIQDTEGATAQSRATAAQAPAPVVSDSGGGDIPQAPVEWERQGTVGEVRPGPKKLEG